MSEVKIILEGDESEDEVIDTLIKALSDSQLEKIENERWDDHLMNELSNKMDDTYLTMTKNMIKQVLEVIKE